MELEKVEKQEQQVLPTVNEDMLLIRVDEAAKLLNARNQFVYRLIADQKLSYRRFSNKGIIYLKKKDVLDFIAKSWVPAKE